MAHRSIRRQLPEAEFLAFEERRSVRHELAGGEVHVTRCRRDDAGHSWSAEFRGGNDIAPACPAGAHLAVDEMYEDA